MLFKKLPEEFRQQGLFCCWRYEDRGSSRTKVPYNPLTGKPARSNDAGSFTSYLTAVSTKGYDGIGVGIINGVCAVDLDDCIRDSGYFSPEAVEIITLMHSYTEISPSGNGVHILFRADGFQYDSKRYYIMNHKAGIEVYVAGATNKYVTVTGQRAEGNDFPFGDRSKALAELLERYTLRPEAHREHGKNAVNAVGTALDDEKLLSLAMRNDRFRQLWNGSIEGFRSQSEADLSLCGLLAFWTGKDPVRMDALFRRSGLMREKWDEKRGGYEYACRFYEEAFRFAQKEYGQENIVSAVMHADELNTALTEQLGHPVYHYHMHVVALPVVDKEVLWTKRCKDLALVGTVKELIHQISHSKKWASPKITDKNGHTQIIKSYSLLQDRFFEHMRDAGFEDFERGERGSTAQHLSVTEFKVKKEREMLADIEEVKNEMLDELGEVEKRTEQAKEEAEAAEARAAQIVPKVKKLDEIAKEYADDPEKILPQSDVLESARSYREKKAKPAIKRLQRLYLALYNAYYDLKRVCENLQKELNRALGRIGTLEATIDRMIEESAEKAVVIDKYETLCRGIGRDLIEDHVRAIREREAYEKQQRKQAHRRHEIRAR